MLQFKLLGNFQGALVIAYENDFCVGADAIQLFIALRCMSSIRPQKALGIVKMLRIMSLSGPCQPSVSLMNMLTGPEVHLSQALVGGIRVLRASAIIIS